MAWGDLFKKSSSDMWGRKKITEDDFKVPFSQSARNELAVKLARSAIANEKLAGEATELSDFYYYYDKALEEYGKLSQLEGKATTVQGNLSLKYSLLKLDEDELTHKALQRVCNDIIKQYKGVYKYDRNHIKERILTFKEDVDAYSARLSRFREKNAEFANTLLGYICHECKMPELLENNDSGNTGDSLPQMSLSFVDSMDGHAFEYWCAELLRKNGFSSIEVTQGSGDQGVDVIATKDDIRYAIQCKCYSSDLGNKPIQEVNTGKALYKCHVGVVMTNRYFTQGGKEAADATGVLLWDRDKLQEMINKTDMGDTEIQVDKAAPVSDDENNSIVIYDELFFSAGDLVIERKEVNVSMLQQELLITYDVAAIVHQMEKINMITLCDGEYILLIGKQQWEEWKTWKRQNS